MSRFKAPGVPTGQPLRIRETPEESRRNAIQIPVTASWKEFLAQHANSLPSLRGSEIDTREAILTLSLETLLGIQSGPSPNGTVGKVQLVDANGDPIGQHYDNPLRMSQDRGGTADAALYTRTLVVNPRSNAVAVDLVTSDYRSDNRFPVDASIGGGVGETARNPLFVNVVNQPTPTPAAGGLEPKSGGYFKTVACTQRAASSRQITFGPSSRLAITRDELGGAAAKFFRLRAVSVSSIVDTIPRGLSYQLTVGSASATAHCLVSISSGGIGIGSFTIGNSGGNSTPTYTRNWGQVPLLDSSPSTATVDLGCWYNVIGPWLAVEATVPLELEGITSGGSGLTVGAAGTLNVGLHFDVLQTPSTRARDAKGRFVKAGA